MTSEEKKLLYKTDRAKLYKLEKEEQIAYAKSDEFKAQFLEENSEEDYKNYLEKLTSDEFDDWGTQKPPTKRPSICEKCVAKDRTMAFACECFPDGIPASVYWGGDCDYEIRNE